MTPHQPRPAFSSTSGPSKPKIVLLGEAWGESEDQCHRPFAGESGRELWRMLGEAMPEIEPELHARISQFKYGLAWVKERESWLSAAGIAMTNVLAFRPPGNKLEALCDTKKAVGEVAGSFPPLQKGKYLRSEYLPELDRLFEELNSWRPNLVICLGNTACWALLRATNIGSIRGAVTRGIEMPMAWDSVDNGVLEREGCYQPKVLPTYHPAGVLQNWAWRPTVVADLMKASREARYPEIRRPARRVLASPTLAEISTWVFETIAMQPEYLSPDIETASGQITCIGFARSISEALVIPFWDRSKPGWNYWQDPAEEKAALGFVARLLESEIPKVFQNGIYDVQYITRYGIRPVNMIADTMLLHHSMYPELQKGLGFLGSIYTDESSWKLMRRRAADTEKKDE